MTNLSFQRRALILALSLTPLFSQSASPAQDPAEAPAGWRRIGDAVDTAPVAAAASSALAAPAAPAEQAPPAAAPTTGIPSEVTVPLGTWLTVRSNQLLSSDANRAGDTFTMTLTQPLVANGYVIARRGQTVAGRVVEATRAGRVRGGSRLVIELTELTLVDGQQLPLRSELIQYSGGSSAGRDATALATTTGIGALIGAAADGGSGAAIGAGAGAAAALIGVLVTRGRSTIVDEEALLTFRTSVPLRFSTANSIVAFRPVGQEDFQANPVLQQRRATARNAGPVWGPGWGGPVWGGWGGWGGWGPGWYGPGWGWGGPRVVVGRGWGGWGGRRGRW